MRELAAAAAALDGLDALEPGPDSARQVHDRLGAFLRVVRSDADPGASARVTQEDLAYLVSTAEGAAWMAETFLDLCADDRYGRSAPALSGGPAAARPVPTKAAALEEMWDSIALDLTTVRALARRLLDGNAPERVVDLAGHEQGVRDRQALAAVRALLAAPPPLFGRGRTGRAQAAAWAQATDAFRKAVDGPGAGLPPAGRDWLPGGG